MRTLSALVVAAVLSVPAAASAQAYRYPTYAGRDSWYIGFGLGSGGGSFQLDGERVNFRDFHNGPSPLQLAFQLELGATVSPQLLVGGEISGLTSTASQDGIDSTLTSTQLLAVLTFFPQERGLFLRAGAGFAGLSYEIDDGFVRERGDVGGVGLMGGVGYAWWLGQRFNLTLHADLNVHAYAHDAGEPSSSTALTGYLGFRWY